MRNLGVLTTVVCALAPSIAAAQTSSAQAEQLFRDGKSLMAKKQYAEACTAFEGSDTLDPAVSTKMNLADCREKNGQIATAWGLYVEVVRLTRDDAKQKALMDTAKKRADALEPRLSYLIVNVSEEARVDGLTITRNGEVVEPVTWNTSLPIDGGDYVIEGKAPAHEAWSTTVHVEAENDKQSVDVPKFKEMPVEVAPEEREVDEPVVDRRSSGMSGQRKLSIGLAVVGLAGVVGGVVFEVGARSTYEDAKVELDDARRADLTDQANVKRGLAIGAGSVGVVAIGVAAYLWITGGTHEVVVTPTSDGDSVGFAIGGTL